MIDPLTNIHPFMRKLARKFDGNPQSGKIRGQFVYRVTEVRTITGALEKRIVELANGNSIGEIIEILYREEIRLGAWIVDIAMWKDVYDQSVINTIRELTDMGHIILRPGRDRREAMKWRKS